MIDDIYMKFSDAKNFKEKLNVLKNVLLDITKHNFINIIHIVHDLNLDLAILDLVLVTKNISNTYWNRLEKYRRSININYRNSKKFGAHGIAEIR